MKKTQVVTAIIEKNGKFLLGKRSPSKKSAAGYWCPISGRIEAGESEEEAISREVMEEVGLEVVVVEKICDVDNYDGNARLHWWLVKIVAGEAVLKNDEHTELKWVTPEEMVFLQPIFEEDVALFRRVRARKA